MHPLANLRLLVTLAVRSLFAHWAKSLVVGSILAFGTFLMVLGLAFSDSIDRAMRESVTASLTGHLQVHSADARDELAVFGGGFMGADDIGRIDDFSQLQDALSSITEIEAVVPMGIDFASVTSQGELETALGAIRTAVREGEQRPVPALKSQVREILSQMKIEREQSKEISSNKDEIAADLVILQQALEPAFWDGFDADPLGALEFLDTKVAPLADEGRMIYFRYLGTDVAQFSERFKRFKIVEGQNVPPNTRGFLLNQYFYDEYVKHIVARNLDQLRKATRDRGKKIDEDKTLQARVRQMVRKYRRITYQLDPTESEQLKLALQKLLPQTKGELAELLQDFLNVNDANFEDRYAFFYREIAPKLDLYEIHVGDTMTIRSYTRSGFLKSVNVKVYGVFQFEGLERSDLAGGHCIMDMITFREVYGLMTETQKQELAQIRTEVGIKDVAATDAEAALFGDSAVVEEAVKAEGFDEFGGADIQVSKDGLSLTFSPEDVRRGLALNAAILLKDPSQIQSLQPKIMEALKAAGLNMKVVDWQSASGIVGQFVVVIRVVLAVALLIIFTVALVIINNSMVMATMERTTEIGTMRAIGAQRGLVLVMFVGETLVLAAAAGVLGMLAATGLLSWLGQVGLAAPADELIFIFGGPRLFPFYDATHLVVASIVVAVIGVVSTLYPAYLAAQIQPIVAMREKE